MRKIFFKSSLLAACVLATGMMSSCANDENENLAAPSDGKTCINLNVKSSASFLSRAVAESDYRNVDDYTVSIKNSSNEVVASGRYGDMSQYIEVPFGSYVVYASYGADHTASRNEFLSEGRAVVNLLSGETKSVNLACAPTCGKVAVNFAADMSDYFDDYYVEYSTPALGSEKVTWAKGDTEPWYLTVAESGDKVRAVIHLVSKSGYELNVTNTAGANSDNTITREYQLKRDKSWTLNIAPNYDSTYGSISISVTIDETTNDKEVNVTIPQEYM